MSSRRAMTALEDWEAGFEVNPPVAVLGEHDAIRMQRVIWSTPAIALPPSATSWGRRGHQVTGRDVAVAFASVADAYSQALVDRDNAREELRTLKADVATMRRVLFGAAGGGR